MTTEPQKSIHYKPKKKAPAPKKPVLEVSQSMIKDVRKYLKKQMCGLVLQAKYITKTYPYDADDSAAKKIGRYFEFLLTGALPKSGIKPEPEVMVSVLNAKRKLVGNANKTNEQLLKEYTFGVDDYYEGYRLAHANAARIKYYFQKMKIEILEVGVTISKDGICGTLDVIAMYKGQKIVIDIKYSGLIEDRWNEMGWTWTHEQKRFHGTQAVHYHLLTDVPFYFLVVSSTNLVDVLFNEILFDDLSIAQHKLDIEDTRTKMETYNAIGFNAYPDIKRCGTCALKMTCPSFQDVPEVKIVLLQEQD